MQPVIRRWKPNVQIGDALLKSKPRDFTDAGEVNFAVFLRDGTGKRRISLS
jgi:hypothetical protein